MRNRIVRRTEDMPDELLNKLDIVIKQTIERISMYIYVKTIYDEVNNIISQELITDSSVVNLCVDILIKAGWITTREWTDASGRLHFHDLENDVHKVTFNLYKNISMDGRL